jgi:excisionase family DNA binding protein
VGGEATGGPGGGGAARWLTIEAACRLLGVDQSTLRRWSDAGRINVFVTPGGHRRYAESDVLALIEAARGGARAIDGPALASLSLGRYGSEVRDRVRQHSWYGAFDEVTLAALREEGRQLVELAMRYVSARDGREAILAEATGLAEGYGRRNAGLGVSLADGVAAFLFFRGPTVATVAGFVERDALPAKRTATIFRDLGDFLDHALLAMIGAHERALRGVDGQRAARAGATPEGEFRGEADAQARR